MKRQSVLSLVLILCSALLISSCSSSTSSTNTPAGQSVTVGGTTTSNLTVVGTSTSIYQITGVDAAGAGATTIGVGFGSKPTSSGTYTAIAGNPSGTNCVVALIQNQVSYGSLSGGSVQVSVSGSSVTVTFSNLSLTNPINPTDTKTVSANLTAN